MEQPDCDLLSYCSQSDFIHALHTISKDLSVVGLPPIAEYEVGSHGVTIASLINTVWTLLGQRQHLVDDKRQLGGQLQLLAQNLQKSKQTQQQLEKNLVNQQECQVKEKKKHLLTEESRSEALDKSKSLMLEVKDLKQQLKGQEVQFKHEYRRQQEEVASLTAKLRKSLSREKGEYWKGHVGDTAMKAVDVSKEENMEKLYKKSIHRLENNVQALVKENLELRKLLDNVSEDVTALMKQTNITKG